jgi:Cu-Zn family superoxide dismutase
MKCFTVKSLIALSATALIAGCATMSGSPSSAVAQLQSTSGSNVKGSIQFEQKGSKVLVIANVTGLEPNTEHGFHVHEKGDCSAPDGTSAGGHFNPLGHPHGSGAMRHVGDMPNLKADASGVAKLSVELDLLSLGSDATGNIVGRAVIVHKNPDDYTSQPVGNAGARLACGVIKAN